MVINRVAKGNQKAYPNNNQDPTQPLHDSNLPFSLSPVHYSFLINRVLATEPGFFPAWSVWLSFLPIIANFQAPVNNGT